LAKLAECPIQIFQSPRGTLQNHQPFRMSHSSFRSGNFSSVTAWPESSSVTQGQVAAGPSPVLTGSELPGAEAPPNQVRELRNPRREPCLLPAPRTHREPRSQSRSPCRGCQARGYTASRGHEAPCKRSAGLVYQSLHVGKGAGSGPSPVPPPTLCPPSSRRAFGRGRALPRARLQPADAAVPCGIAGPRAPGLK